METGDARNCHRGGEPYGICSRISVYRLKSGEVSGRTVRVVFEESSKVGRRNHTRLAPSLRTGGEGGCRSEPILIFSCLTRSNHANATSEECHRCGDDGQRAPRTG